MSIDTLLEAAKFVEWSDQIRRQAAASGQNEALVSHTTKAVCSTNSTSFPVVYSSPSSSPGSHKSLSPRGSCNKQNVSTSNTDTLDEGDDKKSGTREVHNKLEKNRRAHLKDCFDNLRNQIPSMGDKKLKPSNLSILQGALRYLQALKRKERELEYETERLARQKIQYQERLAKLSGCSLPPWKREKTETKEEVEEEDGTKMAAEEEEKEDDRESVSTSTSTASEAEEEERKSRAQSPEVRLGKSMSGPTAPKTDVLTEHVIKVTQSVKEQSGPFVISREIVTHVPVPTSISVDAQQHGSLVSVVAKPQEQIQKQQGTNYRQKDTDNMRSTQEQSQWVVGSKVDSTSMKEVATSLTPPATQPTPQVALSQKIVIRPQSPAQQAMVSKLGPPKQQMPSEPALGKTTSDSHSSALSAVQEHLKNKAQNKLPQQQKQLPRTNLYTTVTTSEPAAKSKASMGLVSAGIAVSSAGLTRQTVSQLLGKQPMVIRQPVRRSDNKVIIRQSFSPRPQMKDIIPKSPVETETIIMSHMPTHVASVASKTVSKKGSSTTSVNKQVIPMVPVTTQSVSTSSGMDVHNLISHNIMLPSIPHCPPTAGLATAMLPPSLTNSSVLTAANVALLSQAMLANSRNITPQFMNLEGKTGSHAKPRMPVSGMLPLVTHAGTHPIKASSASQAKPQTLSYTTPITAGHPFLSPVPIQPALTQVLFTQPPIAAYTIAASSLAPSLVKTTLSPQPVIRHSVLGPSAGSIPQVVTNPSISQMTSATIPVPPVVTIGAVPFNPLLSTNRALVTAPTLPTTLSFSQYSQYRFPFSGQVPVISPVNFNSSTAVPVTNGANQTSKAANGVVVHTVPMPAALPETSPWLGSSPINNGIPAKELTIPVPTQLTSITTATAQPTVAPSVTTPPAATLSDNTTTAASSVTTATSS